MSTLTPPASISRVSIVIPAFNHGAFVAEAIESVLAQDYPGVELIVIDDGSTDNTREVLAKYAGRARVISQPNAGQAATINRGWTESSGDIVSYLSADDRLEPVAVSQAVATLEREPDAMMAYGDYDLIDPSSRFVRHVTTPEYDYTRMVATIECAPGPGVFIRRWAAEQAGGWNPKFRQAPDFEYWLRLSLLGPFVRIPHVLAGLRVHPGSTSYAAAAPERSEEMVRMMEAYFARLDLPQSAHAVRHQALSSAHLWAARSHIRSSRMGHAVRSLRTASALSPSTVISCKTARLLTNAFLNRAGHRVLWHVRGLFTRRSDSSATRS